MKVTARIGSSASRTIEVVMNVDSDAFHTVLPRDIAFALGIRVLMQGPVRAGEAPVNLSIGYLRLMDREGAIPIVVAQEGPAVLGWSGLECLGLRVDETTETLEYNRPFGPALLGVTNG